MIPIGDHERTRGLPAVTWTLIGLNVLIYFWDRQGQLFGQNLVFADLALRPDLVVAALFQRGDLLELGKVFTSMFLHAGFLHLAGNMLFLYAFGDNIEGALGSWRFALYYLAWGVVAAAAHVFVEPSSPYPTLGASGAIGGVLGAYFLLFPANRVTVVIPPFIFWPFVVPAWIMLGVWFLFQILLPQEGVANWAHAGGFMAGMATVLLLGGRQKVLSHVKPPVHDLYAHRS